MSTVLITGGSSGIGYEISKKFAENGYHLLWVSILETELSSAKATLQQAYKGIQIDYFVKDLRTDAAAKEVVAWVEENNWEVGVLINNAGFGTYGYTQDIAFETEIAMIQLNVLTVFKLTRLFLVKMLAKNEGTIINISSNSSFQPVARMNTYASTKAFVNHFSRGLQEELQLQNAKVRVMSVCPAAISDTQFRVNGNMQNVRTFSGLATTTAKEVANDVWKGFTLQKAVVISGQKMRFLYFLRPFIPYRVQRWMVNWELNKKGTE